MAETTEAPGRKKSEKGKAANESGQRTAPKGFLLRLDPETMAMVEAWAAQEFRSVNGQLQWIVADALKRHKRLRKKQGPADPSGGGD